MRKTYHLILTVFIFLLITDCRAMYDCDVESVTSLSKNLKSIKINSEMQGELDGLKKIDGIVLIGSSGSGKTTLLNEIRQKCKNVTIPKRFITRPTRKNEDEEENAHLSKEEFDAKIATGEIVCEWKRNMEKDRVEYYGFEKSAGKLPIYSANNAFVFSETVKKGQYLIIGIEVPAAIRAQRLAQRSPDLSSDELSIRVEDPYQEALRRAHIVISNYGEFEYKSSKFDLVTLINSLNVIQKGWGVIKDLNNHSVEYHTRLFEIVTHDVEFSDGSKKTFQYARRSPGVRVLVQQGNRFLITAEWRTEINGWDFRLPGGKLFDTAKEYSTFVEKNGRKALEKQGLVAAQKEIQEECGIPLEIEHLNYLTTSTCGATVEWDLFYYCANLSDQLDTLAHVSVEGERTLSLWLDPDTILDLCMNGSINEDRSAAVLMRFFLKKKQ